MNSGDEETRTPDILLAKQALYQLSYVPLGHQRRCCQIQRAVVNARGSDPLIGRVGVRGTARFGHAGRQQHEDAARHALGERSAVGMEFEELLTG